METLSFINHNNMFDVDEDVVHVLRTTEIVLRPDLNFETIPLPNTLLLFVNYTWATDHNLCSYR